MTVRTRPAGFTLIELIIAIVVSSVVLGAAYRMLAGNQRFYRAQTQIVEVQQNVRAVAQMVPSELRELAANGGDIIAMSDTGITIRAMRGFGVVCAATVPVSGYVTLNNGMLYTYRSIDPARDNVFVFRDGNTQLAGDDQWLQAAVGAVSTSGITCSDGSAGTRLTLTNMVGGLTLLGAGASPDVGVTVGSPVRVWELVRYGLWQDGSGQWWLATSTQVSGAWGGITPVAGPLRAADGVKFAYYDAAGAVTATPANVAQIGITVRGLSTQPIMVQGKPTGRYADSMTVRVALRNN
jgi:prepilin-type N-terminal cleavage/methylation domain-containing protein